MNERFIGAVVAISLAASATMVGAAGHKEGEHGGRHGPMPKFEEMDANADGQLSKAEMEAFAKAHFATMDKNNDGKLSADEMAQDAAKRMQKRQERMIKKMDTDDDGLLSFEEMNAKAQKRGAKMFDRLDANQDGLLSKEEMEKMKHRGKKGDGKRGHDDDHDAGHDNN